MYNRFRMPAEWETGDTVLLAWPHEATDWSYMLESVQRCYADIAAAIEPHARLIIVAPDVEPARKMLAALPQERINYVTCPTTASHRCSNPTASSAPTWTAARTSCSKGAE